MQRRDQGPSWRKGVPGRGTARAKSWGWSVLRRERHESQWLRCAGGEDTVEARACCAQQPPTLEQPQGDKDTQRYLLRTVLQPPHSGTWNGSHCTTTPARGVPALGAPLDPGKAGPALTPPTLSGPLWQNGSHCSETTSAKAESLIRAPGSLPQSGP